MPYHYVNKEGEDGGFVVTAERLHCRNGALHCIWNSHALLRAIRAGKREDYMFKNGERSPDSVLLTE